jgi:hypothetical protein
VGPIDVAVSGDVLVLGGRGTLQTEIRSAALDGGAAGNVSLRGDRVEISGGAQLQLGDPESTVPSADAPDATLSGRVVTIHRGFVQADSNSIGSASQIEIVATDRITIGGDAEVVSKVRAGHSGPPGGIGIKANLVEILEGSNVTTSTAGDTAAGTLSVDADTVVVSGEDADGRPSGLFSRSLEGASVTGVGGLLRIDTRILEVENGAHLSSSTSSSADAGTVDIDASERVSVRGGTNGFSRIDAAASPLSSGRGGAILIDTGLLELRDGGQVSTGTTGRGQAGQITATADRIEISGVDPRTGFNESGFFSNSNTAGVLEGGAGGSVLLIARDGVRISDGGTVTSSAKGEGAAGSIEINGGQRIEIRNATISTESLQSAGGNVKLSADEIVYLLDANVTTDVLGGGGGGGDVTIDPTNTVLNRSSIATRARLGRGGDILIVTDYYFQSGDSILDPSSDLGIDGTINVTSPDTDLTGGLVTLPATYLDTSGLLERDCEARTERAGSFAVRSRPPLPAPPDQALTPVDRGYCEGASP